MDDGIQIFHGFFSVQYWEEWEPGKSVATLHGPGETKPLLQMDSADQVPLYEFKLTADNTITITPRRLEVEAAWRQSAERYKLPCVKGQVFNLVDVFCILQSYTEPSTIEAQELAALKECVKGVAERQIRRLESPALTILVGRSQVLQCELATLTLCLRNESEEHSAMYIRIRCGSEMAWVSGQMVQVMTTEAAGVDVTIKYRLELNGDIRDGKWEIYQDILELMSQGVYFTNGAKGFGKAGHVLELAEAARPPPFRS